MPGAPRPTARSSSCASPIGADVAGRARGGPTTRRRSSAPRSAPGFFPADYDVPRPARSTTRWPTATSSRSAGCACATSRPRATARATAPYLVTGGERTYLLAGDAVFAGGKLLLQAIPDCDLRPSLASVRRLAELEFDALLPGHGAIALHDGGAHVGAAVAAIDRLAVPPSMV